MLVLVIDTSSEAVTAAVVEVRDDRRVVAPVVEEATINARGHGELLAPEIQRALEYHDATVADLGAIVVGTGPGPYTGLRVGLVTAAVMGEALGIPTYGVCSLDGIAADDYYADSAPVLVVTDARRKEVYWARYQNGARVDGPGVDRPSDVPTDGTEEVAGYGAILYDFSFEWTGDAFGGSGTRSGHPQRVYPSATGLVRCAVDRIVSGAPSEQLTPLYLRRPDAVAPGQPKQVTQ